MKFGTTQADKLNHAIAELRRVAKLEGIETLFIVATRHRAEGAPHRSISVGSIDGCKSCALESVGRLIGMGLPEMMIADHLSAIQSAYADRAGLTAPPRTASEESEVVWCSPDRLRIAQGLPSI